MAKILVVDDSATQSASFTKILQKQGHEVVTAVTGQEGVSRANELLPDLILMDVVMPELNGFQATRQITRNDTTSHIPVIIVSSKSEEVDQIWGRRQGARAYLTKPVAEDLLLRTVSELLPEA